MKKKIATFLMCIFSFLCVLTGCNLFTANASAKLESIVAKSGNIEITREQLINAYNSSGYYYNQYYGYTMENALKQTINDLISRQYLLQYIEEESKTNKNLMLSDAEVYEVITETWEYIDASLESYAEAVEKEMGIYQESEDEESEDSSDGEYSGYKPYSSKFYCLDGKIYKYNDEVENTYVPDRITPNTKFEYKINIKNSNPDFQNIVWNRYISALKAKQSTNKNLSDEEIFKQQISKIYESNLENAKIQKFKELYENTYGLDIDSENGLCYVNESTLNSMIDYYTKVYNQGVEDYQIAKESSNDASSFYSSLTKNRDDYFYYGEGEEDLLTCIHILIKFSDEQTEEIENCEENSYNQQNINAILKELKSTSYTMATERNPETGKNVDGDKQISVKDMFSNLLSEINKVSISYTSDRYLEKVTEIFNKYVYTYGMDTGIMNATFDYVVGTSTSQMVSSFTEVVRALYNNGKVDKSYKTIKANYNSDVNLTFPNGVGYAGAISEPFLEEASNYTGYHIVLFTGKLKNIPASSLNTQNIYDKLGETKTSLSYNQSIFEYLYDKVAKDNYSKKQSNIVNSTGNKTNFYTENFSDLYD